MLEHLTIDTFSPLLGNTFTVHVDATTAIDVDLVEVTDLGAAAGPTPPARQRSPFSIVFRSTSAAAVEQRIYRMEHATLGTFELFLVPIGPVVGGMGYEAVFN